MTWSLFLEQCLNGLQFGLMLFLLAAGLTLVFGIMDLINLAHGSLYMIGAYLAATLTQVTGSYGWGLALAVLATGALGMLLEAAVLRHLYRRDHLSQVLATFALILIANETTRTIWPIAVSYFDAQRLIIGWCELRQDFRSFRTDRMLAMEVLKDKYPERRKVLLKRWQEAVRKETGQPQLDVFM